MAKATFDDLLEHIIGDQTPRVWSLLVTVFGELAQDEGAQIKSTVLSRLTALMGIKPEAMRVALHRLRKDGWIESNRSGRTSSYALTDWGRSQSAAASPRIYGTEPIPQQAWLALFETAQAATDHNGDGVWVTSTLLVTTTLPNAPEAFVTEVPLGHPLPAWMTDRICPPDIVSMTQDTLARLDHIPMNPAEMAPLDSFEIAALRILIVDRWRRVVLKAPHLPAHTFPSTWQGAQGRQKVSALLAAYEKHGLDILDAAV